MKALAVFSLVLLVATGFAADGKVKKGAAKVVSHVKIQALLPQMPGWSRGEVHGETVNDDPPIARVHVSYEKAESQLAFEIMDTVMNKDLLSEMREKTKPGYSEKSSLGFTRATTVKGFPAVEEWTPEAKNGYVSVLVAERFTVAVTGSFVANLDTIRRAVEAIDLQKIAELK